VGQNPENGASTATEPLNPMRQRLTLLVPALNEEEAIGGVIRSFPYDALRAMGIEPWVLVVDGHSHDRTREIAERAGAEVTIQPGRGKGDGIRHGLRHATGDMVLVIDADGTYPPDAIPSIVERLSDGCDVVVGSRIRGSIEPGAMPRVNYVGNRFLSLLATALYGTTITDVCSGMWGLRTGAIPRIEIRCDGFDIEPEVIAEACRLRLRVQEVPIAYSGRKGETKLSNPLRAGVLDALRLLTVRFRVHRTA